MKMFSISAIVLITMLLGMVLPMPEMTFDLSHKTRTAPKTGWTGNWPGNSGYHNYGWTSFDASGVPTGSAVTIYWTVYDVPNRFTISDNCGLGVQNFTNWQGSASYGGPWGSSISNSNTGSLSVLKQAGCNSYKFSVETSTGSSLGDGWAVNN